MFPLIRNIIIIYFVLTVVYVTLSLFARWRERNRLEAEYRSADVSLHARQSEDAFVADGMKRYYRGWRPKMILLVYIVPSLIAFGLIYLAQYG